MPCRDAAHDPVRRQLLASISALAAASGLGLGPALAEDAPAVPPPPVPAATPFDFDVLTATMRERATQPDQLAPKVTGFLDTLTYQDYQKIAFRPDRARWAFDGSFFRVHAYHLGWLFDRPVHLFEVVDGQAQEMVFTTDDFVYREGLSDRVPPATPLPGVAGFRLNFPLNRPDTFDELVSFLGASYFRALGRGNTYGLSARGLAINTGLGSNEEFPRFSAFYLERPALGATSVTVNAALDSPSVTGAFRFVITPGAETVMEVTARLFFRDAVDQLGLAPLTSMFLYSSNNRAGFDDYRPEVHDSDGLVIHRADGDHLWRALNNPPHLASSLFGETSPKAFGLMQRDRSFDHYQDVAAQYERRPSILVEPVGDWGKGSVRLVEIPSDSDTNDNIVAFWIPEKPVAAGDMLEVSYRLRWGTLPPDPADDMARVWGTLTGHGGAEGVKPDPNLRTFVVDFRGGLVGALADLSQVSAIVTISHGEVVTQTLSKLPGTDICRLTLDVSAPDTPIVELVAHLAGYGRKLSETWLYQWMKN